jgi:hypothetical protein
VTVGSSEDLWMIEPLLEAGLDLDDVRTLLTRVCFECLVSDGRCDVPDAITFLPLPSNALRAAWIETVDRMLRVPQARSST